MDASPLARSLLALACFALLLAVCNAKHKVNNCAVHLTGQATVFTRVLATQTTPAYQGANTITNEDQCAFRGCSADKAGCPKKRRAVGSLITVCDYYDMLPPSIESVDIFTQIVKCNGPCPGGLSVSVTQYCSR